MRILYRFTSETTPSTIIASDDVDENLPVTSFTVPIPTGTLVGHLIFLWISTDNTTTISTPSGYTEIYKVESDSTYRSWALYYKVAVFADIGSNVTITTGTAGAGHVSSVTISGKTSAPYFTTVSSANHYAASPSTSLTANTSGGLTDSIILAFTRGYTVTIDPGMAPDLTYTFLEGYNKGNVDRYRSSWIRQTSDGDMESYTLTSVEPVEFQIFQLQVL